MSASVTYILERGTRHVLGSGPFVAPMYSLNLVSHTAAVPYMRVSIKETRPFVLYKRLQTIPTFIKVNSSCKETYKCLRFLHLIPTGTICLKKKAIRKRSGLTIRTSEAIAHNLEAVLEVAGGDTYQSKPMKLAQLHAETGIAKSTLFKISRTESAREQANPDLETICRVAEALKIPPGLLLMDRRDIGALIGALDGLSMALDSPQLQPVIGKSTAGEMSEIGLRLAEALKLYPESEPMMAAKDSLEYREQKSEVANRNENTRRAILSTTALLQSQARNEEKLKLCTAIGAMMGAAFKSN